VCVCFFFFFTWLEFSCASILHQLNYCYTTSRVQFWISFQNSLQFQNFFCVLSTDILLYICSHETASFCSTAEIKWDANWFYFILECRFFKDLSVCVIDEGYQRRVTVDDEDSSILVFDSWKQVSQKPSQMHEISFFICLLFSGFQN